VRRLAHQLSCSLLLAAALVPMAADAAFAAGPGELHQVARFDHQVTGVTVSQSGRTFVNFPRWQEDVPVSVAEVLSDGSIRPYPDREWNSWRNARKNTVPAATHFVCVQSVVVDHHDQLWVLDPAAPAQDRVVPGGPKLVKISLATDRVVQTISFDETIAPQGSYLNDVRFSPDDRYAYITDSGGRGAIVVVDLMTGAARRTLDGDKTTRPEPDVVIHTDGRPLVRPDGRRVELSSDGIALAPDGSTLYWQALTGKTLYSIAVSMLQDPNVTPQALAGAVRKAGRNGPADGLWIDEQGRMFVTAFPENAVKVREGARYSVWVKDRRLRWPDTFAEGPDGALYVTTSHIQDMQWFKPRRSNRLTTELWRIRPPTR
jgi:sugar lactone lactonase YvrE